MANQSLFQPLLPTPTPVSTTIRAATAVIDDDTTSTSPSNSGILLRLLLIIIIGSISIWANHEASKGFYITIINDAKDFPAGKKFALFYESDDKATRILLNTSSFVHNILYNNVPHDHRKPINHVTLRFSGNNNSTRARRVSVMNTTHKDFVISLSLSMMEDNDFDYAITSALLRAMARIWLWDGYEFGAPLLLVDGMVEYIATLAGFGSGGGGGEGHEFPEESSRFSHQTESYACWENKDPTLVARFLGYCEGRSKGFIQRLNRAMRRPWSDRTVESALGVRAQRMCDSYTDVTLARQ